MALRHILGCPYALLDDGADGIDIEVEQPSGVLTDEAERALGHLGVADQEHGRPLWVGVKTKGARVRM